MHRGGGGELVGHIDAHAVPFHGFDGRTVHAAVVSPTARLQARCQLVLHLLGDQMVDLHAVDHLPRQGDAVGRYYRLVVFSWLTRREIRGLLATAVGSLPGTL